MLKLPETKELGWMSKGFDNLFWQGILLGECYLMPEVVVYCTQPCLNPMHQYEPSLMRGVSILFLVQLSPSFTKST